MCTIPSYNNYSSGTSLPLYILDMAFSSSTPTLIFSCTLFLLDNKNITYYLLLHRDFVHILIPLVPFVFVESFLRALTTFVVLPSRYSLLLVRPIYKTPLVHILVGFLSSLYLDFVVHMHWSTWILCNSRHIYSPRRLSLTRRWKDRDLGRSLLKFGTNVTSFRSHDALYSHTRCV